MVGLSYLMAKKVISHYGLKPAEIPPVVGFMGRLRGADFRDTTVRGFTAEQFYSTASYQSGDLSGVVLSDDDLSGWSFAGRPGRRTGPVDSDPGLRRRPGGVKGVP